jgi:hypothetical protein
MSGANALNSGGDAPLASKIMLIRHAEKPPDDPPPHGITAKGNHDKESLTVVGWQRAGALAVLFAPSVGPFQSVAIATPRTIYAMMVAKHSPSERPQETVSALIAKLGGSVTANFDFAKGQEKEVAASALACNGVVLICWEHHNIPLIAKRFPISPNNPSPVPAEWPDDRYDVIWVFDLDTTASGYCFAQVPQLLLAGDGLV